MLQQYLSALINRVKVHPKVKVHSQLRGIRWTKSGYYLFSQIIAEELSEIMTTEECLTIGTTISPRTIQKIMTGEYRLKYPIDPRVINTLNKLAIFLGFKNWDHFIQSNLTVNNCLPPEEQLKVVMQETLKASFLMYQSLPIQELKLIIEKVEGILKMKTAATTIDLNHQHLNPFPLGKTA